MDRSIRSLARPATLLALALLLTAACTAAPAAAGSPTSHEATTTAPAGGGSDPSVGGAGGVTPAPSTPGPVVPDPSPSGPDEPIVGGPGGPAPVDPEDQWQTIQARPGLKDLRAQAWDRVSLSPDGMTLTVYFYGGVEGCYGLSEVRVTRTAGGVATVTVITGTLPALGDMACIDIAVAYKTTVQLDQPLIIDGAAVDVR